MNYERIEKLIKEEEEYLAGLKADLAALKGNDVVAPPVQLREFLNEQNTDFEWMLSGSLAFGSVAMLAAEPALGKTTLLVQMALCLSAGMDPFRRSLRQPPIPCLYIAAEGSRGAFQNRVKTARESLHIPEDVGWFIQRKDDSDYKIGSIGLEGMIRSSGAKLVVLDTIGYFWSGDENNAVEWKQKVMVPLRKLTAAYGCTFLLVHHFVKASEDRKGWQRARGTSAMYADLDAFYQLTVVDGDTVGDKRTLTQCKNKYGVAKEWGLTFNANAASFD